MERAKTVQPGFESSSDAEQTSASHEPKNSDDPEGAFEHVDEKAETPEGAVDEHPSDAELTVVPDGDGVIVAAAAAAARVAGPALPDDFADHVAMVAPAWDVGVELAEIRKHAKKK